MATAATRSAFAADRVLPAEPPRHGAVPDWLHPDARRALSRLAPQPYTHQTEVWEHLASGEDVMVVTPTASGKSLCYLVPTLHHLLSDPGATALFIYPTKALSRDQESGMGRVWERAGHPPVVYDGDTPMSVRREVRDRARVVLTNPDMLHAAMLPHHDRWHRLLAGLRLVVLDEAHTYRGVFGSHVSNVLRRLQRAARFHGASPQFVLCSATLANPGELASRLLARQEVHVVDRSGAPTPARRVLVYNPPVVEAAHGIRRSYIKEARRLVADLLRAGVRTLVFCNSRLYVELLLKYLREDLQRDGLDPTCIQGYRGGYLPGQRRRVERDLREGRLRGVVATSALELGIDIGVLEAVVVVGYPGSIAGTWQRFGRAGRRGHPSLAVLVASAAPVDQYLAREPELLLGASPEHARIDPHNPLIVSEHVLSGAFELPFDAGEGFGDLGGDDTRSMLEYLRGNNVLVQTGGRYHWAAEGFPADRVSLRGSSETNFVVVDRPTGDILAEVDFESAHTTLFEGAIYNLDARQLQVERLDYDNRKAYVRGVKADYFTQAISRTKLEVLELFGAERGRGAAGGWDSAWGEVKVQEAVAGYKKLRFGTHENIGYGDIHLPERTRHTGAAWITPTPEVVAAFRDGRSGVRRGLAAAGRAVEHISSLCCMCDPRDLGRCVQDDADPPSLPTLYVFDRYPGGVGLAELLFQQLEQILRRTLRLVSECECETGCPACVGAGAAVHRGTELDPKQLARMLLEVLVEGRWSGADGGGTAGVVAA